LFALWRYRGIDPYAAHNGPGAGEPVWPGRVEALLTAFALYAAEVDGAPQALVEAFGGDDER
jgi:hypothetical protein